MYNGLNTSEVYFSLRKTVQVVPGGMCGGGSREVSQGPRMVDCAFFMYGFQELTRHCYLPGGRSKELPGVRRAHPGHRAHHCCSHPIVWNSVI